jgi:hypothetical protein
MTAAPASIGDRREIGALPRQPFSPSAAPAPPVAADPSAGAAYDARGCRAGSFRTAAREGPGRSCNPFTLSVPTIQAVAIMSTAVREKLARAHAEPLGRPVVGRFATSRITCTSASKSNGLVTVGTPDSRNSAAVSGA